MSAEPRDTDVEVHARLRAWCARHIQSHDDALRRSQIMASMPCPGHACDHPCRGTKTNLYLQLGWSGNLVAEAAWTAKLLRGCGPCVSGTFVHGDLRQRNPVGDLQQQSRSRILPRQQPVAVDEHGNVTVRRDVETRMVCWVHVLVWLCAGRYAEDDGAFQLPRQHETIYVNTAMAQNLTAKDLIDGLTHRAHAAAERNKDRTARDNKLMAALVAEHRFRSVGSGEICHLDRDGGTPTRLDACTKQTL